MWNLKYLMVCGVKGQLARVWASLRSFLIITLVLATAYAESGAQVVPPNGNQPQVKPIWSASQAHRILKNYLAPMDGQVTNQGFSFIWDPISGRKYVKFSEIKNLKLIEDSGRHYVSERGASDFPLGCLFSWPDNYNASQVVHAINAMRYYSSGAASADETANFMAFKEKAKAWRALAAKPSLPASANRYRVLAEDAFKSKDFDKAIDYYDKALEAYPLWPQGQFNAALICGETGDYAGAVDHMKRYLELAPDAKDAKAAQEKIFIWEEKAKQ